MQLSRPLIPALLAFALFTNSCTSDPYTGERQVSKTAVGSALGGLAGAGIGVLTGDNSDERRKNALIGAGIGVLAGGGIGLYMDRQEAKLREELRGTGVSVTRRGDQVILNMPGNITFETASAQLAANFVPVPEFGHQGRRRVRPDARRCGRPHRQRRRGELQRRPLIPPREQRRELPARKSGHPPADRRPGLRVQVPDREQ